MKEQFIEKRFDAHKLTLIETANGIIAELQRAGYSLTLRQLYYQLVARGIIENRIQEYKRLGEYLNDARLAGLTDWDAIEDRTRSLESVTHWDNPAEIIEMSARGYRIDKWQNQDRRVEVWVEKDALVGVLEKACRALDVAWFSCRGYTSQSELYTAGKRLAEYADNGQEPIIIHLGDHDPSGIDMTRDIQDRVSMLGRFSLEVRRIALNMDQVERYNPPPNPAKTTDARYEGYRAIHGEESWELDALSPQIIDALITKTVKEYRNEKLWREMVKKESEERDQLTRASDQWERIVRDLDAEE